MKLILLLLLLVGCSKATKEEVANCPKQEKIKIAEVDGCDVYRIYTDQYLWQDMNTWRCRHEETFLFTDCRNTSLKWNSGGKFHIESTNFNK